jgi:hypothetical protein
MIRSAMFAIAVNRRRLAALCSAMLLLAPAHAISAPLDAQEMASFLAQVRCADGALAVAEPGCPGARPQRASDPMRMRRHDWPAPDGYQVVDSFIADDGASFVSAFSFAPFGPFAARNGDGGEVYVIDGDTVRIAITEDGGQMGVVQGFFGAGCGGTGWVLFRADAPTGQWAQVLARLKGRPLGSACAASSAAFTRYRLEDVALPFIIGRDRKTLTLPTIISEHFNAASLERSSALERTFMVKGVGRAIWEAWSKHPATIGDLDQRCPGTAWSTPPAPGWFLTDCRYATNLVPADGAMTGDRYGWPPKEAILP